MKTSDKGHCDDMVFTGDNPDNIRKVMTRCKNVLICGIKGVGKITNSVNAVKDNDNVFYVGNPVDFEGKRRPGSYKKYIQFILFQKKDILIIEDIDELLKIKKNIVLIIDEIYGRSEEELEKISRIMDMKNIRVLQIVGCIKYMGKLIDKIDVILQLHPDMAFAIDREFAKSICEILGKK